MSELERENMILKTENYEVIQKTSITPLWKEKAFGDYLFILFSCLGLSVILTDVRGHLLVICEAKRP